ncbi:MAG: flagellar basal body P-ring formation chaperone FlgA [Bdellovibrionota bacterium]
MKFFFAFLFCLPAAFACEISMPHRLVILSEDMSGQSPIVTANCSEETTREFHKTLTSLEGRISSSQLTEIMAAKNHSIKIDQHMVQIQNLKSFIREQLNVPGGVHVKNTYAINSSNFLALAPGDQLQLYCSGCMWGNRQTINLTVAGFDGTRRDFVAVADFGKMVRAFRLTRPLNSFSEITVYDIKEEYTEAVPHTEFISDVQNLKYYKSNKPLKSGELLRISDLNALNIVKAGLKTEVVLENDMVRIKTSGISRGNGALGDIVEVYHPQKNKKYQGKVIDNNKVLVEL